MTNIQEGLQKWIENGRPTKTRREKFEENPIRKLAIDLFCLGCLGGEDEPGIRNHIKNCTSPKCPLYQYRPYK